MNGLRLVQDNPTPANEVSVGNVILDANRREWTVVEVGSMPGSRTYLEAERNKQRRRFVVGKVEAVLVVGPAVPLAGDVTAMDVVEAARAERIPGGSRMLRSAEARRGTVVDKLAPDVQVGDIIWHEDAWMWVAEVATVAGVGYRYTLTFDQGTADWIRVVEWAEQVPTLKPWQIPVPPAETGGSVLVEKGLLTEAEDDCLTHLKLAVQAWSAAYDAAELEAESKGSRGPVPADHAEFVSAIHTLQNMILSRVAARVDPVKYRL